MEKIMVTRDDSQKQMIFTVYRETFENLTPLNFDDLQAEVENMYKVWRNKSTFNSNSLGSVLETLKSTSKASDLRLLGNEKYKDGFDEEALQLYTQSIAFAVDESEEQALAYANRSASHFRNDRFIECLLDINRALQGKYPETLRAKLDWRKENCLVEMRRLSEDKPQFKLIQGNETDLIDAMKNPGDDEEWRQMCKFGNPLIQSASPKIKLEYDEYWGRHVVATEDIEPGEILSCQKYFTINLLPEGEYKNCSYCMMRCYALVPCLLCTEMYCSKACLLRARGSYHYMECKMFRSRKMSYSEWIPTLFAKMLRALLVGTKQGTQLKSLMETMKMQDIFVENSDVRNKPFVDDYLSVLRLCRTYNAGIIKEGILCVLEMVDSLQLIGFFKSRTRKDDPAISSKTDQYCLNEKQLFVAMLLLNHYNTLHANLFAFDEMLNWFPQGSSSNLLRRVGRGVCPLHNLLNHSCDPNSDFFNRNGQNVVFALQPIKKGEQIFTTYCGNYGGKTQEERKKELIPYGIVCQCEACVNDWPLINVLEQRRTEIFNDKHVSARFRQEIWPDFQGTREGGVVSNLSNGEVRHLVCKVLKFLHANVSRPSYLMLTFKTYLKLLTLLLYDDSSRELIRKSQVEKTFTLTKRRLADELGPP